MDPSEDTLIGKDAVKNEIFAAIAQEGNAQDKPLISVVIPSLNEEKYIENTLKAIVNQDFEGMFEIIVSDGCSTDRTLEIAKEYADKVVTSERGISKGRNAGAALAQGQVIVFVDADTILMFNTLSELWKTFQDPDVSTAACPILPISPNGREFFLYWSFNNFVRASIAAKKPDIAGLCFACRKDAFDSIGGFDESIETMEDFDLSERLGKIGRTVYNDDTFVLTSPRRLSKWGGIKSVARTFEMYAKYLITGNGVDIDKYEPVR